MNYFGADEARTQMCTLSVSNVIYHKFSHGAAFYTLNVKNVNVMLELRNNFSLPYELTLSNTCCWRADHEILMHVGEAGVH